MAPRGRCNVAYTHDKQRCRRSQDDELQPSGSHLQQLDLFSGYAPLDGRSAGDIHRQSRPHTLHHSAMTLFRGLAVASFLPLLSPPPVVEPSRYWFDDPKAAVEVTARILATGAPSTYQVITISIPDRLPRRGEGRVEIIPRKGFNILGTHAWSLPALEGKNKVIGIIGIPASARAGLVTAADVNFSVAGAPMITVAVEIDVSLIRELAVQVQSAPLRVRAGGQVTFSYELVNTGNSTESIETSVAAPSGWKANQRSGSHASVDPDQSAQRQVVVSVPPGVSTGSF